MKKNVIAVMLSLVMAVGSVGTAVPAFAAEEGTTAEAAVEDTEEDVPEDVSGEEDSGENTEDAWQSDSDGVESETEDDVDVIIEDDISDDGFDQVSDSQNPASETEEESVPDTEMQDEDEEAAEESTDMASPAGAVASGKCGANLTWALDGKGTLTISGTGAMDDYGKYETYSSPWFENRESVRSVAFPSGITHIGNYAFFGCSNLNELTIPANVTSLGYCMIMDTSIQNIIIPKKVSSCSIEDYLYSQSGPLGGSNVTKVEFEDGMKTIPDNICAGGHYIEQFQRAPTPETIIQEVVIPDSVTTIGTSAFSYCKNLSEVKIPSSVTKIGASAFYYCTSLSKATLEFDTDESRIGYAGLTIESGVFAGCSALSEQNMTENAVSIGPSAFSGCGSLTEVISNAKTVDANAFRYDNKLKTVVFKNVESLGATLFGFNGGNDSPNWSGNVSEIKFTGNAPSFDENTFSGCTLTAYYPESNRTWTSKVLQNYGGKITWTKWKPTGSLTIDPEFSCSVGEQIIISSLYKGENTVHSATIEPDLSDALDLSGISIVGPVFHGESTETYISFTATAKKVGEYNLTLTTDDGISASTVIKVGAINIAKAEVKLKGTHLNDKNEECMYYTGKQIEPGISEVIIGDTLLTEGEDYIVSYGNNIEFGEGRVIIEGIGNCVGKKSVPFNIVPKKLAYRLEFDKKDGYRNINVVFDKKPEGIKSVKILCYSSKERREYKEIDWEDIAVTNESDQYILKIPKLKYGGSFTVIITPGYKGITGDAVRKTISVPKALLTSDFWGFRNSGSQVVRKKHFEKFMGPAKAKELAYVGAVCYGMCLSGLNSIKNSSPDISSWQEAGLLSEVNKKSIKSSEYDIEAIEYIKYAQVIQYLPEISHEDNQNFGELDALYSNLILASKVGSALFIDLQSISGSGKYEEGEGHSILALDVAEETDTTVKILCYDSNYINNDRFMYLYRNDKNSSFNSWKYDPGILMGTYSGKAGTKFFDKDSSYSTGSDNDLISYTTGDADYFKKVWERMSGYDSFEDFVLVCVHNANSEMTEEDEEYLSTLPYTDFYYSYLTKRRAIDKSENDGCYFWSRKQEFDFEGLPAGLTMTLAKNEHSVSISSSEKINTQMSVSDTKDCEVAIEPYYDGEANIVYYDAARESNYSGNTELTVSLSKGYKSVIQRREDYINITGAESISITKVTGEEDEDGAIAEGSSITISSDLQFDKHYRFEYDDDTARIVGDLNGDGDYETEITKKDIIDNSPKILSGTCGENVTWKLDEDGVLTISGTGGMKSYDSQSPFSSYDVKKVIIEEGVTYIGRSAFRECSSLTSVTIPETMTDIGHDAFNGCSSLTSITMPEGVTFIGSNAFYKCTKLKSVKIPGVRYIGERAFAFCSSLKDITISINGTQIEEEAFSDCSNLSTVNLPPYITNIDGRAFHNTPWLKKKGDFPTVEGILLEYQGKEDNVVIPDNVTTIGAGAFKENGSLLSVTIPNSVTSIRGQAFYNCDSLKSVIISDSVTDIYCAFRDCRNLKNVTLPRFIKYIDEWAFNDCDKLTVTARNKYGLNYCKERGIPCIDRSSIEIKLASYNGSDIRVNLAKREYVSGYQIKYADNSSMTNAKSVMLKGNNSLSKVITGLKNGKTYYVKIQSYLKLGSWTLWSNWSPAKSIKITQTPYPTNVSKLSTYIGSHIKVDWTKTAGASGYHIKYADNSKMTGAKEVMVKGNSTFTKTLTGLKNGKTYYVKIQTYRTVSGKTYWSSWSPAKSIKVDQKPYGLSIKKLEIVSGTSTKVVWNKSPGASGYHIQYRWYDSKKKKYVTKDIFVNGNGTLSKTITGLIPKKDYYIRIQTFRKASGKTYWSPWSQEIRFWVNSW